MQVFDGVQPKMCCFTSLSVSTRHVGARELTGDLKHEADGLQEALQQHLRGLRDVHHLLHHSAAQCLPLQHEPARHGARPRQTGREAALLPGRCDHLQQHHAPQRHVFLQERDANQVGGCLCLIRKKKKKSFCIHKLLKILLRHNIPQYWYFKNSA